jgi:hypothetical protein
MSNCGVFTAGRFTSLTVIALPLCNSSERTESERPCTACLAEQYADCSGMPR